MTPAEPTQMQNRTTCATCKHWSPKSSGEMAKHLLCRCAIGPAWRYWPPQGKCSSHLAATPKVVADRQAWIARSSRTPRAEAAA